MDTHHDFVLEHLARDALRCAHAQADRRRLARAARAAGEERMDTISGFVALVVQPDAATIRASYDLAATLMPPAPEQVVGPGSLPHVTLTQCALRDAPRERIAQFIARLAADLRGLRVPLGAVTTFGAGFLFWCAASDGPERRALQTAHEHAVTLADGLLDPEINAAVVEATRKAFDDDRVLVDNARRYGYALIRERYLPHITLGFDPRLAAGAERADRAHTMTVDRVVLARLGRYGRVEAVVAPD